MNTLESSKIVRAIMKSHGKNRIFNNLYPSMRSVKCYAGSPEKDEALHESIAMALLSQGVTNFQVKRTARNPKWWGPSSSFIVRLF